MDLMTVVVFLLIMGSFFYKRLTDAARKDAARKPARRPAAQKNIHPAEKPVPEIRKKAPDTPYMPAIIKENAMQRTRNRKKTPPTIEKGPVKTEENHSLAALKNVSEARRAFIYSEIFNRKYE